ncbi:SDR family oxidoreductase [Massilia violaceinigra]|uniref:SDR family oxidoreductase n=1 Tax=Massilia violaceinigra TaxID=2045208 RepID=A0ABY4AAX9_9BURK|nr:SDR family oxidoreductase [Massilia violaceinigra]UOD30824.1 SDR family oxidoreductase [Massilia violaceinigra]
MTFTNEDLATTLRVLQAIADQPSRMNAHPRFKGLIAKIQKTAKREQRQARTELSTAQFHQARLQTGMVQAQQATPALLLLPPPQHGGSTLRSQRCYVCKQTYHELHHFYHLLCPVCAAKNWAKREQRADLGGYVALVTGGRIKIGFETALRLLRDGARVIVTTRFPRDAERRFLDEPDAAAWRDRLTLEALDLRNIASVEALADTLCRDLPHLDIIINNAAQTIKRPREFYAALMAAEPTPWLLEASSQYLGQLPGYENFFLSNEQDSYGQALDKRPSNSWSQRLHEVSTLELVEVQVVNAIAPFLLTSRLRPALLRSPNQRRFVVQASAMEGQFNRQDKTAFHPHTNMAKAALNMLVRTSAQDWARDGIYMNAVDTGWITDEKPYPQAERMRQEQHFYTPLDVIDGMARLIDPIMRGINEPDTPLFGHFLKDYEPYAW